MNIHVVRAIVDGDSLNFKEEVIAVITRATIQS